MQLKNTYSAREVASMTGLSARQLQWWDARRLFLPAIAPQRTEAGGVTARSYNPPAVHRTSVYPARCARIAGARAPSPARVFSSASAAAPFDAARRFQGPAVRSDR